ncbi:hypothetical protein A3K01_02620 [candidate division WWE3 bacterium RIFOXYD1_FULL_43_17]|uniref:Glycosyltransferase RgtA/B/C/D-like domain-containing protein n=3 Tax=Katanobacteria TaxID=422282 RepID=A0A1F4XES8_UNCKA|nr:MAG: hypothetical protein UU59_C0006G0025 [candidate division WWE3 bacterium GW2011_GWE1_41_27]KKS60862.1 MAG: hypothetical protein UV26_C0001G0014 [candidate division WWE3 bacterium GW2011_GWF2_42_42]OGC80171.1 MAG: hypothetical protein A3K01_02620 [candidate division WWE3 bacterium RIFOXYD1_FULL_43_17]
MYKVCQFIIFQYNDSAHTLAYHFKYFSNLIRPADDIYLSDKNADFVIQTIFSLLHRYMHPVCINNMLVIVAFFLAFAACYLLFRKLNIHRSLQVIFSLLYSASIYFIYRVESVTPALYMTFIIPATFFLYMRATKPLVIGLFVATSFMISNYYGFFALIVSLLLNAFNIMLAGVEYKRAVRSFIINSICLVLPILTLLLAVYGKQFLVNTPLFGNYEDVQNAEIVVKKQVVFRPVEDWYNLSFRPWYFFIPPKESLFFGKLSEDVHKKIEITKYYLADDYTEQEMAGSYLGWHFIFGAALVVWLLLMRKFKHKEFGLFNSVYANRVTIYRSLFLILCILLISGPPSFTVNGVEIYTPTYILYYLVPVFRTLVRWSVLIYLCILVVNSFLVQDLYSLAGKTWQKTLFIVLFIAINFVIFTVKIPVININKPPSEIAFVKEKFPTSVSYAVYPKGDFYSIFWILSHEDILMNPVDLVNFETGFETNVFSRGLISDEGLKEFLNNRPKYLIYYSNKISDDSLESIKEINPGISSREDIYRFFIAHLGVPLYSQGGVIIFGTEVE